MDLNTSLGIFGAIGVVLSVFYARRGAVASEKALELQEQAVVHEAKSLELSDLEQAILRAAKDALRGCIYLHRHFEDRSPAVIFGIAYISTLRVHCEIPSHDPIPDRGASCERLVNLGYLEFYPLRDIQINLSTDPNTIFSDRFEALRITPAGRVASEAIPDTFPAAYLTRHELNTFRSRR